MLNVSYLRIFAAMIPLINSAHIANNPEVGVASGVGVGAGPLVITADTGCELPELTSTFVDQSE